MKVLVNMLVFYGAFCFMTSFFESWIFKSDHLNHGQVRTDFSLPLAFDVSSRKKEQNLTYVCYYCIYRHSLSRTKPIPVSVEEVQRLNAVAVTP